MLEDARKKGASVFVYLIFSLLILIFVINFGPQGGQGGGCGVSDTLIISVDGEDASQTAYQIAYQANNGTGKQKTYTALELLIREELLAQEATNRGLRVTEDLVMDEIKKGYFFLGGRRYQIPNIFTEDGYWNQNAFSSWVNGQLSLRSRGGYVDAQQRSLLAALMTQMLEDSVQVSRDEALAHYLFENNTAQYDVVAFRPAAYRAAMKLTDADVERFLSTHQAEVEARYKADERTYKGVKPQLHLRQIFIEAPTAPAAAAPAPDQGSAAPAPAPDQGSAAAGSAAAGSAAAGSAAAGSAAAPADAAPDTAQAPKPDAAPENAEAKKKLDEAKKKLEAVRTAAAKDKQKFIDAAKKLNTEEAMKNSAGELGWRTADSAMLGDKALTDAVKSLKPGEMTPVITTERGAYLILAEDKREGDLTFDQVKHEIAREMALDVWSKEAAKRAALAALDKARAGTGLSLDQLYEKRQQAPANPGIDIQELLNNPNIPPEEKQKILDMLMKSQGQQGSIVWESQDVPAGWKAQADGAGGSAAPAAAQPPAPAAPAAKPTTAADKQAAPATKPAAPATTPAGTATKPAAPAAKTASPTGASAPADKAAPATDKAAPSASTDTTAAGSAPAAGSAAAPAAGAPGSAEAAPAPVVASSDKLPAFGEIQKPTVTRFGPAPRASSMPGIGINKQAAAALFDELTPGMLAKQVYEGDDGFVVMQLVSRSEPKVEDFDKQADRMIEELRAERAQAFVEQWLQERCEKLAKEEKIKPNPGLIRDTDDAGNVLPTTGYRPCMSFQ